MARTRIIFQNLNLFVGPAGLSGNSATGQLYSGGNTGANLVAGLARVQSANLAVTVNRQDINEFGQLARIDSMILQPPQISLDWNHYIADMSNEKLIGMEVGGGPILSGILTKISDSKNYFVAVSPQGTDDDGYTGTDRSVYAIGNGFISNYSMNLAVGQPASASVTVDGMNIKTYTTSSGNQTPAIDPATSAAITTWNYQLPIGDPRTGVSIPSALRPGDITLAFPSGAGFLVPLSGQNSINVQSVSVSIPVGREVLNRLGSTFGFSREITFPVTATMQCRAMATEVIANDFVSLYANDQTYDFAITQKVPGGASKAFDLWFKKAKISNINTSNSIGSNSTVDFTATTQIQGANDTVNGVTLSGVSLY